MSGLTYARDTEVAQRLRPEPMTAEEELAQKRLILWISISLFTK